MHLVYDDNGLAFRGVAIRALAVGDDNLPGPLDQTAVTCPHRCCCICDALPSTQHPQTFSALCLPTQKLGVLDAALAQPSGRQVLQGLPPDAMASLLGCNSLAVISENTVIAVIDLWLAGPVASALMAHHPAVESVKSPYVACQDCCITNTTSPPRQVLDTHSSSGCSCSLAAGCKAACADDNNDDRARVHVMEDSPLLPALELLVSSVRLSQCSGAFLATAVQRMPWLCRVLAQKAGELELLQQYYRCATDQLPSTEMCTVSMACRLTACTKGLQDWPCLGLCCVSSLCVVLSCTTVAAVRLVTCWRWT